MGTDDDSSVSDPEPDQDDDDPSYTPGRGFSGEKGGTKRPRGRPPGKGKKRKTDKGEGAEEGDQEDQQTSLDMDVTAEESERASRMRPVHTPAEVIATPAGKEDGLWVHLLVASGSGLWRLPNVEHLVDHCVEPGDVVKTLNNASVKIIGSKVYYKFDDL
ncbi:hypothetical protein BaRGS_00005506 [Batillaria attramentaria]|uniref:Uncharacterized protein n=1 Tax=Batillaria attramentaria TaxID=370345 RepID=A0ABD0LVN3_9CAEN